MRDYADILPVPGASAKPADEAARQWRANLPGELRERSLVRGGVLLLLAATGYVASMVGAVWLPTFFWRTVSLILVPMMVGSLFVIGHDAAHNSFTPYGWLNRLLGRLVLRPEMEKRRASSFSAAHGKKTTPSDRHTTPVGDECAE